MRKLGEPNRHVSIWLSEEMTEQLYRIANSEHMTLSDVLRELVQAGLIAKGYTLSPESTATIVNEAVTAALRPQVERLAAMNAKAAQISAAAFFLAAYSGKQALPPEEQAEFETVAAQARKLGVEYLKLAKDKNLDTFVASALQRIDEIL